MENVKRDLFYIKFIFFLRYFADSLFYSFTAIYLASLAFGEGLIGNIQSITTITCLIVNPIWSYFTKNNKTLRKLLLVLAIVEGALIFAYTNVSGPLAIMIITSLLATAAAPYYHMLDGYAVTFCEQNDYDYSQIRVMGSLAYTIGVLVGGVLIDLIGFSYVFGIAGAIFIVGGILTKLLKKLDIPSKSNDKNFKEILKNKWLYIYVIAYICIVTLNVIGDNFVPLLFTKEKGLTTTQFSIIQSAVILTEVITLIILARFFRKTKHIKIIFFLGLVYGMRCLLLSFTHLPLPVLIFAATLRGVAWACVLFVHMKYLTKLVGIKNITSSAILVSVVASLVQFGVSNFFGYIIEDLGYGFAYRMIAMSCVLATIIYTTLICIKEKRES